MDGIVTNGRETTIAFVTGTGTTNDQEGIKGHDCVVYTTEAKLLVSSSSSSKDRVTSQRFPHS